MIHSHLFSFDESTDWNVKQVRKHLCIPEDQFNTLSSLPGWSKEESNSFISRIDKDTTIENSQSSQFQNCAVVSQNCQKKQNLELFEKHLQYRRSILKFFRIDNKKLFRSSSLINIVKICENVSGDKSLKRTLSVPVLYKTISVSGTSSSSQESFHDTRKKLPAENSIENTILERQKKENLPKPSSEVMEVVSQSPVNILSHVEKVDMPNATEKLSANKSVENSTILRHDKIENPSKASSEIDVMSQLPAVILSHAENADDNKSKFARIEEKVSDTVHATENSENSNNLQPALPANVTLSVNNSSSVYHEKEYLLDKPNDSELCEKKLNSCVVKRACSLANDDGKIHDIEDVEINLKAEKLPEINEKPLENINTLQPATNVSSSVNNSNPSSYEKAYQLDMGSGSKENKLDSCIVKETSLLATDTENGKMNLNNEKLPEIGETCSENIESLKSAPEKPSKSMDNLILDVKKKKTDLQNVISDISSDEKASMQEISYKTRILEKRKLEFKSKISKKRKNTHEKQDHDDIRSIKRAAEIYYSEDSLKRMINLMKGFL